MEINYDESKLKELILYIAKECENDVFFGATKLNKILFFADFMSYAKTGEAITGAQYMAIEYGPVPKRMLPIREEMILDGSIKLERQGSQERVIAVKACEYEFAPSERAFIDNVIEWLRDKDATSVTDLSHSLLGYQAGWAETLITGVNAIIPYDAIFVSNAPPNENELKEGLALAGQHGWSFK